MASPIIGVTQTRLVTQLAPATQKPFPKPASTATPNDTVQLSEAARTALQQTENSKVQNTSEANAGDLQTRSQQNRVTVAEKAGGR